MGTGLLSVPASGPPVNKVAMFPIPNRLFFLPVDKPDPAFAKPVQIWCERLRMPTKTGNSIIKIVTADKK